MAADGVEMEKEIRLDKFLADSGAGTRSQVKLFIKNGKVTVNDSIAKDAGLKIGAQDIVLLEKRLVQKTGFSYYMLNKPQGCVSAAKDNLSETVLELLKGVRTKGLFPVGRLDKDTEGLLLITNDGQLSHELLSPRKHVAKTYYAVLDGKLSDEDIKALEAGIDIGDERPCLPAKVARSCHNAGTNVSLDSSAAYEITITEGRFHQVKRMFFKRGKNVLYLKRLSMGSLILDKTLKPGQFRPLSEEELRLLKGEYTC